VRDQLDRDGDKDQGPLRDGKVNVVPTNANGLTFARTTTEVLRIVYAGREDRAASSRTASTAPSPKPASPGQGLA
jgi:hypothetical protein